MAERFGKNTSPARPARIRSAPARGVERLESRLMLAAHIAGDSTVYSTIQAAVNAAAPGATITVDPGNYPEQVVINQALTIEGAQTGVDARLAGRQNGTSSTESIVTGTTLSTGQSSAFYINANDVTIDGFTVEGETNPNGNTGAGIVIAPGQYGTHIINNVVQNNVSGLFLANGSSTDAALIQHNAFIDNNNAGTNGGRGIYTDENISGGNLTDVTIDSNLFHDNYGGANTTNLEAAVSLEANITGAQSNISITNNTMTGNGKALLAYNATNIVFNGNTVTGCLDQYSGSIRFEGNVQNVTIDNNDIYNNTGPAVAVDSKGVSGSNSGFVINNNDFVNNNAAYGTHISVVYAADSYDGAFNAENNWWDSVSGPSGDGPGSGDAVSAGVFQSGTGLGWELLAGGDTLYSPWSTRANTSSATPPTAPTGLTAVASSATQVALNWTDTAAGIENGFVVQRSTDGTTFTPIGTTKTAVTTYTDKTAVQDTAYTYRVYASSAAGSSAYSTVATVTTPLGATAPTNLVATAALATQVKLSWTDTAAALETGFIIQRSLNGTTFTQVGTTAKGITTYTDATASGATSYTYRVQATAASGPSPYSSVAKVTTPSALPAPASLTAVASSTTVVNLSWTDTDAAVETGFIILRSLNGTTFTQMGTTAKGITTYADATVSGGIAYTYRVQATSAGGPSPYSTIAIVTTPAAPSAPTSLTAVAVSATVVNLSWADTAAALETGFIIQRSLNRTTFTQVGTTARGITSYSDTTISGGTAYTYRVQATSAVGSSAYSTVAKATTPTPPTAPKSLTAVAASATVVNLSWTDTAAAVETGFIIQRSLDGTTFTQIGMTAKGITKFSDTTVSEGMSYTYRVQATSAAGPSPFSTVAKIITPLIAPASLTAVAVSPAVVDLSWTDTDAGVETGFIIQRSLNGTTFTQVGTTDKGMTSYLDAATSGGTVYTYRVQATSLSRSSPYSAVAKVATPAPVTTSEPPTAPTSLTAVAASATVVNLSWTDTAAAVETGFIIQGSLDGATFTQIGTAPRGVTKYANMMVSGGTAYTYRVEATSAGGPSPYSTVATVTTPTVVTVIPLLTAPTSLTAVAVSANIIDLSWTDTDAGAETGFTVERSLDGTMFTQVGATATEITTYADATVSGGTNYTYRVQATSADNPSSYSTPATAATPTPPSAPTHIVAVAAAGPVVHLTWKDTAAGIETGFIIERSLNGSPFAEIGTTTAGVTNYSDTTALGGETYAYLVKATSTAGNSAPASVALAKTPAVATAPAAPLAAKRSMTRIKLSWKNTAAGIATGFVIERSDGGQPFVIIRTTGKHVRTFTDTGVFAGVTYAYQIYATSAGGNSPLSDATTITIYPVATAPRGLAAVPTSPTEVDLSWTDTAAGIETGFVIQRSTNGGAFKTIDTTSAGATTYDDESAAAHTKYGYRIYALSAGGKSPNSEVAKATTAATSI